MTAEKGKDERMTPPTQCSVSTRRSIAEMMHKADCFDYLCWLNETEQSDRVKDADYLVMASDGTTCWGKTYAEAVIVAMQHDKELYDAVREFEANPPNEKRQR